MIQLVWSGRGYLVPVITFGSCLGMDLTRAVFQDNTYYQEQNEGHGQ
jgi:hypothetical protein